MTAPTGFLAGRFGRKPLFITTIAGFTLASALCGAAQSLDQIVFFRVLQGMCGASIIPLSQVVLLELYPPQERGTAMSLWTTGVMMGPILGPSIGGFLTAHYSWRWVFYVNLPLGAFTALGLLICLSKGEPGRKTKLDWIGFAGLSLAIGMFQTVLDRGETLDWFSSKEIIVESFLAAIGFYVFLVQFFLAPKPFLNPRLFADRNLMIGVALMFIVGATLYATLSLLAPYIQNLMNFPVSTAGYVLAPRGVGSMVSAMMCGRLLKRFSARSLVTTGILFSAYVQYTMIYWNPDVSIPTIIITGVIQGGSMQLITIPISTISFSTLAADLRTEASAIANLMRTMGSAIGISISSALLQSYTQINHADISTAITPFNRSLATGAAAQIWAPLSRTGAAALDGVIARQAAIIAYSNNFKLMFVATLLTLPLVLLVRSPPKNPPILAKEAPAE